MKKVKFLVVTSLMVVSSILGFSGCEKRILMDEEKCAEVALEYLENKYQTEFDVVGGGEKTGIFGTEGYANVVVNNKFENLENEYIVVVYPNVMADEDGDGYYDSYKVVSDTYMCYLLQDCTKEEVDKLLKELGLVSYISNVSIEQKKSCEGFFGFSADFMLKDKEKFNLNDILDNYRITIDCYIRIPEKAYSDMLQEHITDIIQPLISDDLITFNIDIYSDEEYKEIEELYRNNKEYNSIGTKNIYFSIEEEEKEKI